MSVNIADIERIAKDFLLLLDREYQYYLELEKLNAQKRALIEAEQTEELLKVLARQQKLVNAVADIRCKAAEHSRNWASIADKVPYQLRSSIDNMLVKIRELLSRIVEQDKEDIEKLETFKANVQSDLDKASQAKRMLNAYGYQGQGRRDNSGGSGGIQFTG